MSESKRYKFDNLLGFAGIAISLISLALSYAAFTNTTNSAVKEKQADAVMKLVQYLGRSPVSITFGVRSDSSSFYAYENYTLLELSNINAYSKLDSAKIYFDVLDELPVDLREFSNNPYMPGSIAKILTKYYSYRVGLVSDSLEESDNSIVLRNYDNKGLLYKRRDSLSILCKQTNQQQSKYQYYVMLHASAYKNWAEFKRSNKQVLDAINKWLEKHNIDEVNIPTNNFEFER
jgi:hypothetical protein